VYASVPQRYKFVQNFLSAKKFLKLPHNVVKISKHLKKIFKLHDFLYILLYKQYFSPNPQYQWKYSQKLQIPIVQRQKRLTMIGQLPKNIFKILKKKFLTAFNPNRRAFNWSRIPLSTLKSLNKIFKKLK